MKLVTARLLPGALLVVLSIATPSDAGSGPVALAFAGTVMITPTNTSTGVLDVCFDVDIVEDPCRAGHSPYPGNNGVAVGADAVGVVDGLSARVVYTETCDPVFGIAAEGTADIDATWHDPADHWNHPTLGIEWTRIGLVALITARAGGGQVIVGAAVFASVGVPVCNQPLTVAVSGSIQFGGDGELPDAFDALPGLGSHAQGINTGTSGFVLLVGSPDPFLRSPEKHDLASACFYHKQGPDMVVTGKTGAGRHPIAMATDIRCRIEKLDGTPVFDETKMGGEVATLDEVVRDGPPSALVRVCAAGHGWWNDGHSVTLALTCR